MGNLLCGSNNYSSDCSDKTPYSQPQRNQSENETKPLVSADGNDVTYSMASSAHHPRTKAMQNQQQQNVQQYQSIQQEHAQMQSKLTDKQQVSSEQSKHELPSNKNESSETSPATNKHQPMAVQGSSSVNTHDTVKPKYILAIDIGQAYCGYAFGVTNIHNNEMDITLNKNWASGYTSYKAPAAYLSHGTDEYFGFDAYMELSRLVDDEVADGEYNFQQNLYPVSTKETSKVEKQNDVLQAKIAIFLLQHFSKMVSHDGSARLCDDVKVMLCVTKKIKKDQQRNLLKQITDAQPLGSLRKYAASWVDKELANFFFCIHPIQPIDTTQMKKILVISTGDSQITYKIYEKSQNIWCKVYETNSLGGDMVTKEFQNAISDFFGKTFVQKISQEYRTIWFSFLSSFEKIKPAAGPHTEINHTISLEYMFSEVFDEVHGMKLSKFFKEKGTSKWGLTKEGTLQISSNLMRSFFEPIVKDMARKINSFQKSAGDLDTIFLTGGMANSAFLRKEIEQCFSQSRIIIPENSDLSSAIGSVFIGQKETYVEEIVATSSISVCTSIQKVTSSNIEHNTDDTQTHNSEYNLVTAVNQIHCKLYENRDEVCSKDCPLPRHPKYKTLDLTFDDYRSGVDCNILVYFSTTGPHKNDRNYPLETITFNSSLLSDAKITKWEDGIACFNKVHVYFKKSKNSKKGFDVKMLLKFTSKSGSDIIINCTIPNDYWRDGIKFNL